MKAAWIMTRRIAIYGILLGSFAITSCGGGPAAPSPVPERPPSASGPPNPVPPANPGGNVNPASGVYGLTLTIGSECAAVPDAEKIRKYTARLDDDGSGRYVVTLGEASFMQAPGCIPLGCNQFRAVEEADTIRFILDPENEWHGGYITDEDDVRNVADYPGAAARRTPSIID